jgi:molecular chaperone HscB
MSFDLTSDYFQLFDLPQSFEVDKTSLMQRYREMQQAVHPDRFVNSSDHERRLSLQYATFINEALRTLKDPLARARYLLQLRGIEWDEEQSTLSDNQFLMQQMELRESLEEIGSQDDPERAVTALIDEVASLFKDNEKQLIELLASQQQEDWMKAKTQVRKMQFLRKMQSEAEGVLADYEDQL